MPPSGFALREPYPILFPFCTPFRTPFFKEIPGLELSVNIS